ncbi:MAG: APC family permease [Holosporales bacterium]
MHSEGMLKAPPSSGRSRLQHSHHPLSWVRRKLFGKPLRNSALHHEQLNTFWGTPILAVDALSSTAYATEEILLALMVLGSTGLSYATPIALAIVALMIILILSYTQTVTAYPEGGGSYTVAKENLSPFASLIAASSLIVDYVLTVSVSVSAGVRAFTSAFPTLLPYKLHMASFMIFFLSWLNLRGIRESARAMAVPVYGFIGLMLISLIKAFFMEAPHGVPLPSTDQGSLADHIMDAAALAVVLRAFAGGCTAMTGIEAIANAGSSLKKPHDQIARRILIILGLCLGGIFLGVTFGVQRFHLLPQTEESLMSQFMRLLWGDGMMYWTIQLLTACILFLAANTAFAAAPRMMALIAKDGWLPKQLSAIGDRLVFHKGILLLTFASWFLVMLFQGDTHALIPLYAIGVFSAFTISQLGMVHYWLEGPFPQFCPTSRVKHLTSHPKLKATVNGVGAATTGFALLITMEAKFVEGGYLVLLTVPCFLALFYAIQRHYKRADAQLSVDPATFHHKTFARSAKRPVVVPISRLHKGALEALALARELSSDVTVLLVDIGGPSKDNLKQSIENLGWGVEVQVLQSPYRSIIQPIIDYVHHLDRARQELAVLVLPELAPAHWWEGLLHNKTAEAITRALSWSEACPGQARVVISVPYHLKS